MSTANCTLTDGCERCFFSRAYPSLRRYVYTRMSHSNITNAWVIWIYVPCRIQWWLICHVSYSDDSYVTCHIQMAEYRLFYRALLQKRPIILRSLRVVATPKVSFAEYRLFYRALLQKRPIILRSLLVIATPKVSFAEYRLFYRALLQKRPIILRSLLVIATPKVSFAEYGLFYRALLQKRPIILRSLLIVATQYLYYHESSEYDLRRMSYGVATTSRLLKMIGLFCKRAM